MSVRRATVEDVDQISAVHVQSWQVAYRGLLPDALLDSLSVEQRKAQWRAALVNESSSVLVCEVAGRVVGFVAYGRSREEDLGDNAGEIYAIYLLPERWGEGVGAALMQAALTQLADQGYEKVSLWVLVGNGRAIHFYEQFGFIADGTTKVETGPRGVEFHEIRYDKFLGTFEG